MKNSFYRFLYQESELNIDLETTLIDKIKDLLIRKRIFPYNEGFYLYKKLNDNEVILRYDSGNVLGAPNVFLINRDGRIEIKIRHRLEALLIGTIPIAFLYLFVSTHHFGFILLIMISFVFIMVALTFAMNKNEREVLNLLKN